MRPSLLAGGRGLRARGRWQVRLFRGRGTRRSPVLPRRSRTRTVLLGLVGEVGAAAHRDRPRDRLSKAGDDDQRTAGCAAAMPVTTPSSGTSRPSWAPEHELADAREPPDPRRLTEGMLLDVPRRGGACSVVDLRVVGLGRGGISAVAQFIGQKCSRLRTDDTEARSGRAKTVVCGSSASRRRHPASRALDRSRPFRPRGRPGGKGALRLGRCLRSRS